MREARLGLDRAEELVDEPRLADARHPDEGDELQCALRPRPLERIAERVELPLPADERRPGLREVDAVTRARLERLPHRHRRRLPLRLDRLRLAVVDCMARGVIRRLADQDPVHRRRRLQPRRGVDDIAGGHSFALGGPGAERDQGLARVDGDSHLELLLLDRPVADLERRTHRAFRVVLVRRGCAEQRYDGVADELLDGAAEALELGTKVPVVRREQRPHVLRVELLRTRGEADEVGEQDRHDLPLLAHGWHGSLERRAARATEAGVLCVLRRAARADDHP